MINRTTTNRVCLPIISMLLLLLASSRAEAKGLLMFDLPTQYVDIAYQLQNSDTSTAQRITPSYGIAVPFAILDPTFLIGSFGGSIGFSESSLSGSLGQSSSSSRLVYKYNVGGILLKETRYPVTFYANSTEDTTQLDFAPASTITYDAYGITGIIKNKILPVSYSYRHDDTKTDNGLSSNESVQDAANVIFTHKLRNLMTTSVNASYQQINNISSIATANTTTSQATFNLNNILLLSNINKRLGTFSSNLFYQTVGGSFPIDSVVLTETYDGSLGRGLLVGGSYTLGSTDTQSQSQRINAGQAFVEHRLFSSLRTRLTGTYNDTVFSTGGENTVTTGTAAVTYTKKLPLDAVLQLEASDTYVVRDSKLNSTLQTQLNELITVVSISQLFPLQNPRVTQVLTVRDRTTNQLFLPHVDYDTLVIGQTTFITIIPTGAIHTGTVLAVTYEFQADPSVKYSTNTVNGSASYTLFNGRYLVQTQYSESSSTLLSGGQGTFAPPQSKLFRAAARANLVNLICGAEYRVTDNFSTRQNTLEGFVYYYKMIDLNTLGLQVSESFNTYATTAGSGFGTTGDVITNTLTMGASWSRPLILTGRLQMTANYQMVRGTLPGRDYLSARLSYDLPLGKFKLHLDASSVVRIAESARTTNNNYLNFAIRRYF